MAFTPKQITHYDAAHLSELQGNVSETVISYLLTLFPPFPPASVVHDNACGSGAVFETIMTMKDPGPPADLKIHATDINKQFVVGCAELAKQHGWPVETAVMPAQKLTFPDATFTHSITSAAFHCMPDQQAAASQVHRTLKSDGIAIANVWTEMPHAAALVRVIREVRGEDAPLPQMLQHLSYNETDLRNALVSGGFKDSDIEVHTKDAHLEVKDTKRYAQLSWSYLCMPPGGWTQKDEDEWEHNIDRVADELTKGHGVSKKEDGTYVLRMIAKIAKSQKKS